MAAKGKFVPGGWTLAVKRSSAGLGLFAGESIPKGACVIEYVGRTVSKEESETSKSKYLFEISKNKTIDGKVTLVGNKEDGSGNYVCILSSETYGFDDGREARVELTFMHLKESLVTAGMKVRVGDLIAYGGRAGSATGTHLHLAPKRVKGGLFGYRDLDRNDAENTFDPAPYWNGMYARRDP